ncbi:MAG: hypothetical protein JRD89_07390 [Deltaproteobacteria bacterium]|nr:hypothetical protein [Deltaproteobacteria bacterium]
MDPVTQVKRMLADIEMRLPAGAPKISQMLPAPSLGAPSSPDDILRRPAEVFRRVEEILPGAPRLSAVVGQGAKEPGEVARTVGATKMIGG